MALSTTNSTISCSFPNRQRLSPCNSNRSSSYDISTVDNKSSSTIDLVTSLDIVTRYSFADLIATILRFDFLDSSDTSR